MVRTPNDLTSCHMNRFHYLMGFRIDLVNRENVLSRELLLRSDPVMHLTSPTNMGQLNIDQRSFCCDCWSNNTASSDSNDETIFGFLLIFHLHLSLNSQQRSQNATTLPCLSFYLDWHQIC